MSKTCNNCKTENQPISVPYVVHESAMARSERQNKALVWVIVLLICLLVGSNIAWLIYENSYEDVVTTTEENILVDAEDNGIANYIGNDGDIYNGEDYNKEENNNENS